MIKRLFSLAMTALMAASVWADDITGNEAITFTSTTSPNKGVYLHGSVFGTDATHPASPSGTFTGTSTNWSASTVLTSSQGASLSSLGNISADATTGAPDGSLAFSHSGAGTLYVVYGATSATDGKFCIATKASGANSYTVTEATMKGINYSGPLGTRNDSYTYTLEQTSIELSAAGTVYLAGTQPYCIYAILFVPSGSQATEKSTPVVYDYTVEGLKIETSNTSGNTRSLYISGNDSKQGFRYELEGDSKSKQRVLTYSNTGGFTQNVGVTVPATRYFAIEGLKTGDLIRLVYSGGTVSDATNSTKTSTIITGTIASGKVLQMTAVDATEDYAVFAVTGSIVTISQIAINKGIKPRVSFKSQNGTSLVYTAKFYEGETLYYKGPGITGTQSVEYSSANNGEVDITATGEGNLECWTMFGGAEDANKSEVDSRVVALPQQPSVTLKTTNDTTSKTYTVTFQEGETLHYTLPGETTERTVAYADCNGSKDIEVTANGDFVCWTTIGELVSSTNTTTVEGIVIADDPDTTLTDVFDFRQWIVGNASSNFESFSKAGDGTLDNPVVNGNMMDLHSILAVSDVTNLKMRYQSSATNAGAGLWINGKTTELTIKNLKKNDNITITSGTGTEGNYAVRFISTNVHKKGTTIKPETDGSTVWTTGDTWVMDDETGNLTIKFGGSGNNYIYSITVTSHETVTPATISVDADDVNKVKMTKGASDVDNGAKTYYTTDGTVPTASSTELTGSYSEVQTEDKVFRTVTISSTGKTASSYYSFKVTVAGQSISPSAKFQTYTAEKALDFTGKTSVAAYIVELPATTIGVDNESRGAENSLTRSRTGDTEVVSDLKLVRVNKVPQGTAFLVKYTDTTTGDITIPYLSGDLTGIVTASETPETLEAGKNLLRKASGTVTATDANRLFEADASGERFSFSEAESIGTGVYYLDVPTAAVGESTMSLQIVDTAEPYLIEVGNTNLSESVVYDFIGSYVKNSGDKVITYSTNSQKLYYQQNTDDGTKSRNRDFYAITNNSTKLPVDGRLSYSRKDRDVSTSGLSVSSGSWLAIHNLKMGDVISIEFDGLANDGTVYFAKDVSKGNTLRSVTVLGNIENMQTYKVSSVDEAYNYVMLGFTKNTSIAQIAINQTLTRKIKAMTPQIKEVTANKAYTISYDKASTLHDTVTGGDEQTATGGADVQVTPTKLGSISAWATADDVTTGKVSQNVYLPTTSVATDGLYDFARLKESMASDYTLGTVTKALGETVTIGDMTLYKTDEVTAKTLDSFAFAPAYGEKAQNDWRLLSAGRMRAATKTKKDDNNETVLDKDWDDYFAILNVKKGEYVTITYSGSPIILLPTSTAKASALVAPKDTVVTQTPFEVTGDGHLLFKIPPTVSNCDITQIEVTSTERVTAPTISERVENGEVVPNKVTIRLGTSNFGKTVTAYYTTDGTTPTTKSTALEKNTTITLGKSCTVQAYCVSETGVYSEVVSYEVNLEASKTSASVVYDLKPYVEKGDTIAFGENVTEVYNAEYNSSTGEWETKRRTDFVYATDLDSKVSVRNGYKSLTYDNEENTIRLTRAMAIHNLAVGDEIVILYKGDGTLYSAYTAEADAFTVDGTAAPAGTKIPSGAVIKITESMYGNNYIVVTPTGDKSGKVLINAIYINHATPDMVKEPAIVFDRVEDMTAYYQITFDKGSTLHYILNKEKSEMTSSNANGLYELPIVKGDTLTMWATRGSLSSDHVEVIVYAPTPAPVVEGNYDMTEASEELPADMEVILDPKQEVTVDGEKLYKPNALTASTFEGRFAFTETNTANKIRLRKNRQLVFNKGTDMSMAILNLKRGDIVAFEYTGSIVFENTEMLRKEQNSARTRAEEGIQKGTDFETGEAYVVQKDGNVLLKLQLKDESVSITKMYISPVPTTSAAAAIEFASANEEYEALERGTQTSVWLYGDKSARQFVRFTNDSNTLPIDGKLSMEANSGELTGDGIKGDNRHLVIHNLAVGDTIRVRFYGGGLSFDGHETKGNTIKVDGRRLAPTDSLQSGDIIVVDKVDYLNNYVVLKLDKGCAISAVYINTVETEKVWMPTITDQGKNIVLIKAGRSSVGRQVTTCYTTDGSEPTRMNGTSGPYDEFDVELLGGGLVTIKAVSYTDNGVMSKVASITIYADDVVANKRGNTRRVEGTFDMNGNKVNAMQHGKIYIRDGKVIFFGR